MDIVRCLALLTVFLVPSMLPSCRCSSNESPGPVASASALPPEVSSKVLAKVGDHSITVGEYVATLERMNRFERYRYQSKERRQQLLDEMIRMELLAQEAKRRGLDKKPEHQERVRQILRDELLRRARQDVPAPGDVPEAQVRAYYEAHKSEMNEPERRRISCIVLPSQRDAKAVLDEARQADAARWGQLVRQRSIEAPAAPEPLELAGSCGIVSKDVDDASSVPSALRDAAFEIPKAGDVLDRVVSVGAKHYVVKLVRITEGRQRSFAEAERSIRVTLVRQHIREAEARFEKQLRERYPIVINEAALQRAQASSAAPTPLSSGSRSSSSKGADGK